MMKKLVLLACAVVVVFTAEQSRADEGMWLLNNVPVDYLNSKYGFSPNAEWIEHVQKSSLRFADGGSASFVSPDGLVMTNHHVGHDTIASLSTAEHDYVKDGFYAASCSEELKCDGLSLSQLISIEDVTARIEDGIMPDMTPAQQQHIRQRNTTTLINEANERTGLRAQVVELYHGARFHLYLYKDFDDVRLVMAPEQQIAFFGGDIDNFEYPRYDLDISFFRVYEDGKPARVHHYFRWSESGPAEGDLVFMVGNPARTRRMFTIDHLSFLRDVELPLILRIYNQREVALIQFSAQSAEAARIGRRDLLYTQNGRKAFGGILAGLLDAEIVQRKRRSEDEIRLFYDSRVSGQHVGPDPWTRLGAALQDMRAYYPEYFLLENRRSLYGQLYKYAKLLVRAAAERAKPDAERLEAFREADLDGVKAQLLSHDPVYDDLEQLHLSDALTRMARVLGGNHPLVLLALDGQPPARRAATILAGTRLNERAVREAMWDMDLAELNAGDDTMIKFALALESRARPLVERYDSEFESVQTQAYAQIANACFEKFGESVYPDATFTPRLSIGTVKEIPQAAGPVPAMTTIGGAFAHARAHDYQPPFDLPERWVKLENGLDKNIPFNFISTNDIIGGNSGSPAFNTAAEIVGIVFDGNIHSLVWDIEYDDRQARAVSVHSAAILYALQHIYGADRLVEEIRGSE